MWDVQGQERVDFEPDVWFVCFSPFSVFFICIFCESKGSILPLKMNGFSRGEPLEIHATRFTQLEERMNGRNFFYRWRDFRGFGERLFIWESQTKILPKVLACLENIQTPPLPFSLELRKHIKTKVDDNQQLPRQQTVELLNSTGMKEREVKRYIVLLLRRTLPIQGHQNLSPLILFSPGNILYQIT